MPYPGYLDYRAQILASDPSSRYPLGDRGDPASEFYKDEAPYVEPRYNRLASAALLVGGVAILARARSRGLMEALDFIGATGRKAQDKVFQPVKRGLESYIFEGVVPPLKKVSGRYVGSGAEFLAEPQIVRDLERTRTSFGALGDRWVSYKSNGRTMADVIRSEFQSKYALPDRTPNGLLDLTVGDILRNQNIQGRFHRNTLDVLTKASDMGIISDQMRVSSGAFGLMRDSSHRVLDTSWASPARLLESAQTALSGFKIAGFSPGDFIIGTARPFFERPLVSTVGNKRKLFNGATTGPVLNVGVGTNVYSMVGDRKAFDVIAQGVKLYDTSIPGTRWVARANDAMVGDAAQYASETLLRNRPDKNLNPYKHFFWNVQNLTGVGPSYSVRESAFGRARDAMTRWRSMISGRGQFVPSMYTKAEEQAGTWDKWRMRVLGDEVSQAAQLNENKRHWSQLGPAERFQAYIGQSRLGKIRSGNVVIDEGYVHTPRTPEGRTPLSIWDPLHIGIGGVPSMNKPAAGIATSSGPLNATNLFLHHATSRLNELLGFTFGLGFSPTPGSYGWLGNLAKLYGTHYTSLVGLEYLKYTDYLTESVTGVSPSNLAVSAYAKAMEARQSVRDTLGIAPAARYMESLMPGSVELPASWLARTALPPTLGYLRGGSAGAIAGGLASVLLGGSDVGQSEEDLHKIYTGEKLESVRRGRWWVLGVQPWGGDKISYYRPNWVARFLGEPQYTDVQYGSKGEYFSYASEAPTPHNLFGLMKVLNPQHFSEKHYWDRPYPFSETGERMHTGEEMVPPATEGAELAARMGLPIVPGVYTAGLDPTSLNAKINRTTDQITELGGAYKFLAEMLPFYDDIFGTQKTMEKYAAKASTITSGSRRYYDEELGGLVGLSELPRRFLDEDKGKQGVNLIPNLMPEWLPGARSIFKDDRHYPVDFTLGDPYARVPGGEYRLPGPGYEAVRPLHSGIPGVYDPVDRLMVLADIAPGSQAYREYKAIVEAWSLTGAIDTSWEERLQQTEINVRERLLGGDWFAPRRFTGTKSGTLEQLAEVNKFSPVERVVGGAWEVLTHDVVPSVGKMVPIFGGILDRKLLGQRSAYEGFLQDQIYGTSWQDWRTPYSSFIRPKFHTLLASDPVTAAAGGFGLSTFMGPVVGVGAAVTMGGLSLSRAVTTGQVEGGYIPEHVKERWELQEYFDALQYSRIKRLQNQAKEEGNRKLSMELMYDARKTTVGFDYNRMDERFFKTAPFRMGRAMRPYARAFLDSPADTQQKILNVIQPMNAPIIQSAFTRRHGGFRFKPRESPEDRAENIMAQYGEPDEDWEGWNPSVDMRAIKIKTMDSIGNQAHDMHYHDIFEADRLYTERSFPGLKAPIDRLPISGRSTIVIGNRATRKLDPMSFIEDLPDQVIDYTQDTVRSVDKLLHQLQNN